MQCPHCQISFHADPQTKYISEDKDGHWVILCQVCPECEKLSMFAACANKVEFRDSGQLDLYGIKKNSIVYPRSAARPPPPPDVPSEFANDFIEASRVLSDSPKASAAHSRRCLQHVIRVQAGIIRKDLAQEIDALLASHVLPTHLGDSIDAIRNIGNFAAHPIKSTTTGEIVEVEPGEAEWNLDVLEGMFDFYFVQPARTQQRKDALNAKLASAGKPPLKA